MPYDPDSLKDRRALATALLDRLMDAGFTPVLDARGERTYQRSMGAKRRGVVIRVYTTIPLEGISVRANGKDAIRVAMLYVGPNAADKPRPLGKMRRVFRTGRSVEDICERTIQRCRDAWSAVVARPTCRRCGTVTFTARSGKDVCAAICWERRHDDFAGMNDPDYYDPDEQRLTH